MYLHIAWTQSETFRGSLNVPRQDVVCFACCAWSSGRVGMHLNAQLRAGTSFLMFLSCYIHIHMMCARPVGRTTTANVSIFCGRIMREMHTTKKNVPRQPQREHLFRVRRSSPRSLSPFLLTSPLPLRPYPLSPLPCLPPTPSLRLETWRTPRPPLQPTPPR